MAKTIKVGDEVNIKAGFHKGDWGIVKLIDEDNMIHVAIFGDSNDCPMFSRNELRRI